MHSSKTKADAQEMWQLCFDDSEEFVSFYFDKVYQEEQTHLTYHPIERYAVAHVQTPLYRVNYLGASWSVNYISGACTRMGYRGQGLMERLMSEAIRQDTIQHQIVATLLIPANESVAQYYQKHWGYIPAVETIESWGWEGLLYSYQEGSATSLLEYLTQQEEITQDCGVVHTARQWANILEEYRLSPQSAIYHNWHSSPPKHPYFALCREVTDPEQSPILIIDFHLGDQEGRNYLHQELERIYPHHQIRISHLRDIQGQTERKPKGMIRITQVEPLLRHYAAAHPNEYHRFCLLDKLCNANTGSYIITSGKVLKSLPNEDERANSISIEELMKRFLRPIQMSLMHE